MILKLENTTTHQTYEYEVKDMNNGEKLYFRFDIDTSNLVDGEYILSLYDGEKLVANDLLKIGDYNPSTLQYKKGENTYINVTLDNSVQDNKTVVIETIDTTITPDDGFNSMGKVDVNAQPLYDNAYHIGHTEGYNEGLESSYQVGYDDGYSVGNEDGYNSGYNVGNEDGFNNGVATQKSKLEAITITENGTYAKEDGYNSIEVNVPDLNGSYDEGYSDGYLMGEDKGYDKGYTDGIEEGTSNAGSIIAETARVLEVTENGLYVSRYSEIPTPDVITGVYADGTEFYNYAELNSKVYNTNVTATSTTRLELWYKGDNTKVGDAFNVIIGAEKYANNNAYQIRYDTYSNTKIRVELGYRTLYYTWDENAWHHILIAKETEDASFMSLWVDEVKVGDFTNLSFNPQSTFYINSIESGLGGQRKANGCYGMIKIDDTIIIPTADGFRNTNTGELLEVVEEGDYAFTDNTPQVPEGNLIKTIKVNVPPIVDVGKYDIRLGYSTFKEVPDFYDFSNVTNMVSMFTSCTNLTKLPNGINGKIVTKWNGFMADTAITSIEPIDTSLCVNLESMFQKTKLTTIPYMDTSNATTMRGFFADSYIITMPELDTRKVKDMTQFFYVFGGNKNLVSLPKIYCDSCTNMGQYFSYYADGMSSLTEVGGWINLKCNWNDRYGLPSCNNLTYQSCINVLNGLYDFTGNGETPTNSQGQLKVHPNFLTTVGDEISIGTNKGWVISA